MGNVNDGPQACSGPGPLDIQGHRSKLCSDRLRCLVCAQNSAADVQGGGRVGENVVKGCDCSLFIGRTVQRVVGGGELELFSVGQILKSACNLK